MRRNVTIVVAGVLLLAACGQQAASDPLVALFEERSAARQAEALRTMSELKESIRRCMAVEGFDYVPYSGTEETRVDGAFVLRRLRAAVSEMDDEFVQRSGYGVTEYRTRLSTYLAADPNIAIVNGLSEEARDVYFDSLARCSRAAREELPAGGRIDAIPELEVALIELDQRILADPAVVDAMAAWSRCMMSEGYGFSSPAEAVAFVEAAVDDAFEQSYLQHPEGRVSDLEDEVIADALEEEIAIATSDAQCRRSTGFGDTLARVREELDRRFAEERGDLIEVVGS